jgi:SAM-dependent methyltransferase
MAHRVCPWWIGYFLASPLRKLRQDPHAMLAPYVREGMLALEPGPGMGFFTLELARLVGARGRVVAVDVQAKMLRALRRRARRAGLLERIETRESPGDTLAVADLAGRVDFALAFAMVHEVPDQARFFAETAAALKPGARLLLAEPTGHVSAAGFDDTLASAGRAGLRATDRPRIASSHAAVLLKS